MEKLTKLGKMEAKKKIAELCSFRLPFYVKPDCQRQINAYPAVMNIDYY